MVNPYFILFNDVKPRSAARGATFTAIRMFLSGVLSLLMTVTPFVQGVPDDLQRAEALYAQHSYALAAQAYGQWLEKTASSDQDPSDFLRREVSFKWADSVLRGAVRSKIEAAYEELKELVNGTNNDRWQIEAGISLSHYHSNIRRDSWARRGEISEWLLRARTFWANSTDLALAREEFIDISFMLVDFIVKHWGWHFRSIGTPDVPTPVQPMPVLPIPRPIGPDQPIRDPIEPAEPPLDLTVIFGEVLAVAKQDEVRARAYYGLGMVQLHAPSGGEQVRDQTASKGKNAGIIMLERVATEFGDTNWADDAWHQLAQYHERTGDYAGAVEYYEALLDRFDLGESAYIRTATHQLAEIRKPRLRLGVHSAFVPGSEIKFSLGWRNVSTVTMALYPVDLGDLLVNQPQKQRGTTHYRQLINTVLQKDINTGRLKPIKRWQTTLTNEGLHQHHSKDQSLSSWQNIERVEGNKRLPTGAYVLVVETKDKSLKAHDLILISDVALVSKVSEQQALIYAMAGATGQPIADARVQYRYSASGKRRGTRWVSGKGKTDGNGLLMVQLKGVDNDTSLSQHRQFFATLTAEGNRQAFVHNHYFPRHNQHQGPYWLYAFSDRPVYRPNEEIHFKALLRQPEGGEFSTPFGLPVMAKIIDGQGREVYAENHRLNNYGALKGMLTLDENALLGDYRIVLFDAEGKKRLNASALFRLEAYKLPEFFLKISPEMFAEVPYDVVPKEKAPTVYRLGDSISMTVSAEYYFGGAVPEAKLEYLVYESQYYHHYRPPRPFGWYYNDDAHFRTSMPFQQRKLILQKQVTLDSAGKATVTFDTPKRGKHDLIYNIEARVIDKSRREIRAQQRIKVTKNAFFAYLEPAQYLYRPGERVTMSIKTLTANDTPYPTEGKITVLRKWWEKPASTPAKSDVVNDDNDTAQGGPNDHYDAEVLLTRIITTDVMGQASFVFEPLSRGYYEIEFISFDQDNPVSQQAHIFVSDKADHHIGYRHHGLQIILEKDTYAVGETARAMLVTDRPESWVLLSQEANTLQEHQLLHLTGNVKLIEFPITENHTPNIFLTAYSGENYLLNQSVQSIIVPPASKFLTLRILSDKLEYQPGEKGVFDIHVTDHQGKPVQAEIALGLVDSAVYALQPDPAMDIREFFYGQKRPLAVRTDVSFNHMHYLDLTDQAGGTLAVTGKAVSENAPDAQRRLPQRPVLGIEGPAQSRKQVSLESNADMTMQAAVAMPLVKASERREGVPEDLPGQQVLPVVREDFRSTVVWQPDIISDEKGKARLTVEFPDALTTWRLTARATTEKTMVGMVTHEVVSNKALMVRLQGPRFFTQNDQALVSALMDNRTDTALTVWPSLAARGITVLSRLDDENTNGKTPDGPVLIPAQGQVRVDWRISADAPGSAAITVVGKNADFSDGMKKSISVIAHGIHKMLTKSAVIKGSGEASRTEFAIDLPKDRMRNSTQLSVLVSPSLAGNLLDALPYLAEFPYGCVEQTMSRFLPAIVVRKTLTDLGIEPQTVTAYLNSVLAGRGDLELPDRVHKEQTLDHVDEMAKQGVQRLIDFQQADGGWGWWRTDGSDPFMTAYVLWGLSLARQSDLAVPPEVISRAQAFLQSGLVEVEQDPNRLAWLLHALAISDAKHERIEVFMQVLWDVRDTLTPYTRALHALALNVRGETERAKIVAKNMMNGLNEDAENGTAYWGTPTTFIRWFEGGVESTAFVIQALSAIDPENEKLAPAVKWLSLNRRGGHWHNTRDTAIAILALADYLKATQELNPDFSYIVTVNDKTVRQGSVTADSVLGFERLITVPTKTLQDAENTIKISLEGKGALYATAFATFFSLEEPIPAAGHEVFVSRQYHRQSAQQTLLSGVAQTWHPLKSGDSVKSGDRIRVTLTLNSKNSYEYILVEDYKPAGLEAISQKSSRAYTQGLTNHNELVSEWTSRLPLYQEFRDDKVAFFLARLPQGRHVIQYELRAEVPGDFHAMPNQVQAMYLPEIRANSEEMRLSVQDTP
jgi:uncharacterized protein YfaS (alpha-2-macroglobulin family)